MTSLTFEGTPDQQQIAHQVFELMRGQATLFADDAPIRQTLANLADFLAAQRKVERSVIAGEIDAALSANGAIFSREQRDGDVVYTTSRRGMPRLRPERTPNMLRTRLYEPENPLPVDDISVVVSTTRPAITTVEPVFISDYWQQQAGLMVSPPVPQPVEVVEVAPQPVEVVEVAPQPVEVVEVAPQPVARAAATGMRLPDGSLVDLRQPVAEIMDQHRAHLVPLLIHVFEADPLRRVVMFGNEVMPEVAVANLSKNDLRKIRDFILEVNEPLSDTQMLADIFYQNPRQQDYESFRFSLNYRLSKERDFEFVGVAGARLWSTKGLAMPGSKRIKAGDMAPIMSYLTEGYDESSAEQSDEAIRTGGRLTHLLTFFEWEYGVLPFDAAFAALLPPPLLPEQRAAVLRFESPQHYTAVLVELRYPAGNRGGWLQGLEDFFREHLIPGAQITLARSEEPNVFTLTYEEAPVASERLLTFDEKKNKFAFNNLQFYAAVDPDQLLTQTRFGRLKNLKALPMNERRKGDVVLREVFENQGEPVGTRGAPAYIATLDELFTAYNVLRPATRAYIQHLLDSDDAFGADADRPATYRYTPNIVASTEDQDEEAEEEENTYLDSRGRRRSYADDDE